MKEWAKVWTDILGDPKLMRAARKGQTGLELTPWLIVFARAAKDGGRLTINGDPVEVDDLLPLIPCSTPASITACLDALLQLAVLVKDEDGALRFSTWEERQAKPSDSREAVRERVERHRVRRRDVAAVVESVTTPAEPVTPVTRQGALHGNATEGEEEGEEKNHPPTPLQVGADAPGVTVVAQGNGNGHGGNGKGKHLALLRGRGVPQIISGLERFLSEVSQQTATEFEREQMRNVMVDLVFAYWAKRLKHDGAKLDRKRHQRLRQRLIEGEDNVHQLLFAVDGAMRDDHLMGRKADSSTKYDDVKTIYRDWEQVERLAALAGYREGLRHPMAVKYLEAVTAVEARPVTVGAN